MRINKPKMFLGVGICLLLAVLSGCQQNRLGQARELARQSLECYSQAVNKYKILISDTKDPQPLRQELAQLYYEHGEYQQAIDELKDSGGNANKLLAMAYYKLGSFTDALEMFNKALPMDEETLYYHGQTSEKLNLFDQAIEAYGKIKGPQFLQFAKERLDIIKKEKGQERIEKISPFVHNILTQAPAAEKYPQAGALILSCDEKSEVTGLDTMVSEFHYLVKILNERGKDEFSEAQIGYDSTYEKVELEYARTIKPDGIVAEVGSRHIRDVSRYLNFPLYSNARVKIISFPEISEGASIEYKFKVYRNQLINKKDFVIDYPLQSSEPIISAAYTLKVPANRALNITVLNEQYNNFGAELKPYVENDGESVVYSWKFADIPQLIPEANMPPAVEITPTILLSTFSSWQEIYGWWWALAKGKINADSEIKEKVRQLTAGLISAEDKVRAICNFVIQKIRYVAVEYGQAGYEPHKAEDIFRNKYGDCKDQAVLLVTMLKDAGFPAWPVLIPTKDAYNLNSDFPAMLFNHAIAAVWLADKLVFVDATAETCAFEDLPPGDQGRRVLLIKEDKYEIIEIPLFGSQHNLLRQKMQVSINSDEAISAKKTVLPYGVFGQAQRYWFLYTPPELIRQQLEQKIQDVSIGASLENYEINNLEDINKPVVLSYNFKGPEYFTVAGNLRILPQLAGMDSSLVAKPSRTYPVNFDYLDAKETDIEFELPGNLKVKFLPEAINLENPWIKYSAEYKYKGRTLSFQQKTELKQAVVLQGQYAEFKLFFETLAKKLKQKVVLEQVKGK